MLEVDLEQLRDKLKDRKYAEDLYSALCNNEFTKEGKEWSCTWRYAGGMIARLRGEGEDYLDYYCIGNEGNITEQVKEDLEALGWLRLIEV
jgi:hypothetical protein